MHEKQGKLWQRWAIRVFVVSVIAVCLAGGWCVYQGVSASIHAEHVLHAAALTLDLLGDYVTLNDGQWPRSWHDLEKLPPRERSTFKWPADSQEVQRYAAVDFSADPQRLAQQNADEFDALRPIGPYFSFNADIEALLDTLRERKWDRE